MLHITVYCQHKIYGKFIIKSCQNLSEGIHRIKCKFEKDDKKCETGGIKCKYQEYHVYSIVITNDGLIG